MAITAATGALLTLAGLIIVGLTLAHPTYLLRLPTRWDGMAVGASVVTFILATVTMPAWHKNGTTQVASALDTATPAYVVAQQTTSTQPLSNTTTQVRALRPAAAIQMDTFQAYWRENFGMLDSKTPVYGRIMRFDVLAHRQLVAYTNIYPDADGLRAASAICGAMAGYVFNSANAIGLDSVWVWGQGDSLLAKSKDAGEPC